MIAINLQTSFLTPPFEIRSFLLARCGTVETSDIYRGMMPFVAIQLFALAVLALLPELATWLQSVVYGASVFC